MEAAFGDKNFFYEEFMMLDDDEKTEFTNKMNA